MTATGIRTADLRQHCATAGARFRMRFRVATRADRAIKVRDDLEHSADIQEDIALSLR